MQERLIQFQTAKVAKAKGFDFSTHSFYFNDGEFREYKIEDTYGYYGDTYTVELEEFYDNWNDRAVTAKNMDRCYGCDNSAKYFETYSAPSQSLLQEWLREKHDIHIIISYSGEKTVDFDFDFEILYFEGQDKQKYNNARRIHNKSIDGYAKYEQALETALFHALTLIDDIQTNI